MPYTLIYTSRALRDLTAVLQKDRKRIISALEGITNEPGAHTRKLEGSPLFSCRVGEYRILLDIRRKTLIILVVGIGHRRSIYQRV